MEDFISFAEISITNDYPNTDFESLLQSIKEINGIESVNYESNKFQIEYYSLVINEDRVIQVLSEQGLTISDPERNDNKRKEKNPFKRYIQKLAASNEKKYGSQRLDCCDLNKK